MSEEDATKKWNPKAYREKNRDRLREMDRVYREKNSVSRNRKKREAYARDRKLQPEREAWRTMIRRCHDKNHQRYPTYGARGITVCERWKYSFAAFMEDMGPRPSPVHQIDRFPDNNGNYELENCRWATPKQQARNRRDNRVLQFNGRTATIAEWAEIVGIGKSTISWRLRHGWSIAEALTMTISSRSRKSRLCNSPALAAMVLGCSNLAASSSDAAL